MAKKKINLSTTNLIIIILIFSIIVVGIKEICEKIQYEKTATVVGEIVYSQSLGKDKAWDRSTQKYYIQLLPLGQEDGALHYFTFTKNSTSESEFSIWMDEMPEFNIGNVVEIEYRIEDTKIRILGKEIISIKSVEAPEGADYSIPLVRNENYFLNVKTKGNLELGSMYYMIRFEEYSGYLIYLEYDNHYPLKVYWIDDEVISEMEDEVKEAFRTGEFGERLRVRISNYEQEQPFVNYTCEVINKIEFLPVK